MVRDPANWLTKTRRVVLALSVGVLSFGYLDGATVHAQSIMRSPNLNIGARIPSINPTVAPRINPDIAGRVVTGADRTPPRVNITSVTRSTPRIGVTSTLPYARYSPNLYPACNYAYRDSDGECRDQPVTSADGGGAGGASGKSKNNGARRNPSLTALSLRRIANELVAEIDASLSDAQADELARRHRLERIGSQNFPLIGGAIGLFRIVDRRTVETASRELATEASVRSVQPNFRYVLQDQKAALTEGDPAQYALQKLRLPQAHTLAHGANVTVAVIDSGIDVKHPELANAIAGSFDALGSREGPHVHGTGIAGAIASHARLMGSAPAARILAIRAFAAAPNGGEKTASVILKDPAYAAAAGRPTGKNDFTRPNHGLLKTRVPPAAPKGNFMGAAARHA